MSNVITRGTKLSELQQRLASPPAAQSAPPTDEIPARLVASVQQSLAVEGYAMGRDDVRSALVRAKRVHMVLLETRS